MNKKSHQLFYIFLIVILLFGVEIIYISQTKKITPEQQAKKRAVYILVRTS